MYIRRKVFSSFIDEATGEERYFSTTEFKDERLYADFLKDMEIEEGGLHEQRVRNEKDAARKRNGEVAGGKEEKAINTREKKRKKANPDYGKVTPPTTKQKAIGWLKKTYGKDAAHRGRNIAITAAVPVVATGGVIAGRKISNNRKAKRAALTDEN